MPRKTTGSTGSRSKKSGSSVQPANVQGVAEVAKSAGLKSGKSTNAVGVNLEEEIRVRAYELYLERRATAGDTSGNPHQDWLIAEREILSRHGGQDHHTA
jgi:Protein of unknown function (DUF2934)